MSILRFGGFHVLSLRMGLPSSGAWWATMDIDSDKALTGSLKLEDDAVSYAATVVRSGVVASTCRVEVSGGAGGMSKTVPARSYFGVTAKTVASELLAAAGERLDPTSTSTVLATALPFWTRREGRAGTALQDLCDKIGARWRILPGGGVWVGVESWPKAPKSLEAIELDRDPAAGAVSLAPDDIALRPGFTVRGERFGRIEHVIGRDGPLRTTAWIDA